MAGIEGVSIRDAFWCAVAVNFSASCVGLVLVTTGHWSAGFVLPLTCLALCCVLGIAASLPPKTRRIGGGGLLGALASALGFVVVIAAVFAGYFLLGGNELS
ncbi:MAG: hypothetical protein WB797_02380 [Nocardioides sp.]